MRVFVKASAVQQVKPIHRNRFLLNIILALVTVLPGSSTAIPAGEKVALQSKILGEDRTVCVALPASCTRSNQKYPVLYPTDAQWQFEHTRATAVFLARNGIIPEMIIVGVTNRDRTLDLYASRADFKQNGRTIPFPNRRPCGPVSGVFREGTDLLDRSQLPDLLAANPCGPLGWRQLCAPRHEGKTSPFSGSDGCQPVARLGSA